MIECLLNGTICEHVPVTDRGLNYGDGLFETMAVVQGRPWYWQEHVDRLNAGCERLGIQAPPQAVLLREVQTVSAGQRRCVVKIMMTRGTGARGYHPGDAGEPTRLVSSHPWPLPADHDTAGVHATICNIRLAIQPALGGIKHLNRLEQVLASRELEGPGTKTGILMDAEGHVISAISANMFIVFHGQILTPRLDRSGVRGVLRARILKAFKSRCELRRITPDMLEEASEVFLSSSLRGIVPVLSIDEWEYPVGPVTRELRQWLFEMHQAQ